MASRKKASRTGRFDRQENPEPQLRKLSRNARAEVQRLLEHERAGDITRVQLQTGLRELQAQLKMIWVFLHMPK